MTLSARNTTLRLAEALFGSFEAWIQSLYDNGIWEVELGSFVMSRGFSYLEWKVVNCLILKRRNLAWRPHDLPLISESSNSLQRWQNLHRCLRDWGSVAHWAHYVLRCHDGWGRDALIEFGVGLGFLEEEMDAAWISLPDEKKMSLAAGITKLEGWEPLQRRSLKGEQKTLIAGVLARNGLSLRDYADYEMNQMHADADKVGAELAKAGFLEEEWK